MGDPRQAGALHWKTYARLVRELQAGQARNGARFTEGLRKLAECVDGLHAD